MEMEEKEEKKKKKKKKKKQKQKKQKIGVAKSKMQNMTEDLAMETPTDRSRLVFPGRRCASAR
ncbi:hypothetical protein N7527_006691 [Penicillium freii]|nr:hypothetical protein N7527_006691 [Penicillium freii]